MHSINCHVYLVSGELERLPRSFFVFIGFDILEDCKPVIFVLDSEHIFFDNKSYVVLLSVHHIKMHVMSVYPNAVEIHFDHLVYVDFTL